ncbi:MAG TPA: hypothetical protein VGT82_08380 [Ktedonobacteraceae bacterium]|nr:hypothetical protein [Ktedonobacteraceae bacterium]
MVNNGETLIWEYVDGSDHHHYVLKQGETIISQLHFAHTKDYDAIVELAGERFFIEKHLTMPYHLILRKEGSSTELARFDADLQATGKLTLADGRVFSWEHPNAFVPEWYFADASGQPVTSVKAQFDFKRPHGIATIQQSVAPDAAVLATLGYYIVIITNLYPSYFFSR